ncbi:hypothetical protein I5677_12095 [Mobilitalea sibirica]|uniref:Uncharacterized protein n=1 Tax=Mobilitalea sibirica TaxID=1462919 RepID=A0A8J7H025_9FIRM|nr:hypothetical protein [Mobilitalea sibirica]MBH1941634.1 hypothetical protein [Mobilitalea sibirica]
MRNLQARDVFAACRVLNKIGIKDDIKKLAKKADKAADVWDNGFDLLFSVFEKATSKNAEKPIYEFIAGLFECEPDEVEKMDFFDLCEKLKEVADPEKWKNFFNKAANLMK